MKELKVVPPEGYEIDQENSTLECIKFKKKSVRWRLDREVTISGYFIGNYSKLYSYTGKNIASNCNTFATEAQAKSALAMARISQIMANDKRFGGVVTHKEWWDISEPKYIISRVGINVGCRKTFDIYHFLAFHTSEQRLLFTRENADLIRDYLMLPNFKFEEVDDDE